MTFEDFYKALREGKAVTKDNGLTYYKIENGKLVAKGQKKDESPCISFPPDSIMENETGYEIYKEPLTKEEHDYLSGILNPLRKLIFGASICKRKCDGKEYLVFEVIALNGDLNKWVFPQFDAGTKYKGMELNRVYDSAELGL